MKAVRAQDGSVYHITQHDLPDPPTLEALHALISEHAGIPVHALIVMHPTGRQVDRDSAAALLQESPERPKPASANDSDDDNTGLVYIFDREALVVDLDSDEGKMLLEALDLDSEHVLADVGSDPDKQYDASIDLIQCIRHQHRALTAALHNLERHRGGRQEAITAYTLFASPLLTEYRNLLAVYPACMSLVGKVRVSAKMQASSPNTTSKDRLLSDFVSREKMENVRDGCRRTLEEIMQKHRGLEDLLKNVAEGTDKLKRAQDAETHLEDLVDCENDAREAHARVAELLRRPEPRADEEEDELDGIFDECVARLRYLVDRRNAETRQLLVSLQEIARLQSQIASAPDLISALNNDLKNKTDSFKHLARLQLLVPAYAATLAESIRRRSFARYLGSSSSAFAELFSRYSADENRRRGVYQAKWASKLPWELPGLEEGLPSVEVELRPSSRALSPDALEAQVTLEDLDALEQSLLVIEDGLSPEDMPGNGLAHPVRETTALIKTLKKTIDTLQKEFEKLTNKIDDSGASPTTSVSVTSSANEAVQAVEEKRVQLERELQSERSAREAEVAALSVKASELEKRVADQIRLRETAETEYRRELDSAALHHGNTFSRQQEEVARLRAEIDQHTADKAGLTTQVSSLQERAEKAEKQTRELGEQVEDLEHSNDRLDKRKQDLLQALNDKDRQLRDHKTEAEFDRATLEKELAAEKQRSKEALDSHDQAAKDLQGELDSLRGNIQKQVAELAEKSVEAEKQQSQVSSLETDMAELQAMCDERGRSITSMRQEAKKTNDQVRTLLSLCKAFHAHCQDTLRSFVREDTAKSAALAVSTSQSASTSSRKRGGPAASFSVAEYGDFDDSSLETAISALQAGQWTKLWDLAKAQCDFCMLETKKWMKECRKYRDRLDRAIAASEDKLAFRSFQANDLALFLPAREASSRVFAAFNYGKPNYFLKPTGKLVEDVQTREWIVARITNIANAVAEDAESGDKNPYTLPPGCKYFMLEAEPWPAQSGRKTISRGVSTDGPSRRESLEPAPTSASATGSPTKETQSMSIAVSEPEPKRQSSIDVETDGRDRGASLDGPGASQQQDISADSMDFSMVEPDTSTKPPLAPSSTAPTPAVPASSLSSTRPQDLGTVTASGSPINDQSVTVTSPGVIDAKAADESPPAFLPPATSPEGDKLSTSPRPIPRANSNAAKQYANAISRSLGSSNGSGGSSGVRHRLSSSSFLTPSKAPATVAASPSASASHGSYTRDAVRQSSYTSSASSEGTMQARRSSHTIGRYSSRASRASQLASNNAGHSRHVSASSSVPSSASAADLLRSFTTGS